MSTDFFDRTPSSSPARAGSARRRTCFSPRPSRSPSATASRRRVQAGVPVAWRNVVSQPQRTDFAGRQADERARRRVARRAGRLLLDRPRRSTCSRPRPDEVVLEVDRHQTRFGVTLDARTVRRRRYVFVDGADGLGRSCAPCPASSTRPRPWRSGSLLAPMPGTVVRVAVEVGRRGVGRAAGARPRGDEDAAHDQRARPMESVSDLVARRRPGGGRRRARRGCRPRSSTDDSDRQTRRTSHEQLHRVRGAADPAQGGDEARVVVRPGVLHPPAPAAARRPRTCGWRSARPATSASTSPRSTAAVAAASVTSLRCARSSPRRVVRC